MKDSGFLDELEGVDDTDELPVRLGSVYMPLYYESGGLEAIDVIDAFCLNFNLGNVIKYVLRAGKKNDALQDLSKAMWYLSREIVALQEERLLMEEEYDEER